MSVPASLLCDKIPPSCQAQPRGRNFGDLAATLQGSLAAAGEARPPRLLTAEEGMSVSWTLGDFLRQVFVLAKLKLGFNKNFNGDGVAFPTWCQVHPW